MVAKTDCAQFKKTHSGTVLLWPIYNKLLVKTTVSKPCGICEQSQCINIF